MDKYLAVLAAAFLICAAPVRSSAKDDVKEVPDLVNTELHAADYHVEAARALKKIRSSIEKVRALLAKAKKANLVVLTESLEKNIASLEGLEEIGVEIRNKLADAVPRAERPPDEREKSAGENFLRQLNVVSDRAVAIYVRSRSFAKKLLRKTGTTITRLDSED